MTQHDSQKAATPSSTRNRIRLIVTLTLLGLIALVALQNIRPADVSVLFWTFQMPLIVVIILSYAVGLIVGWLWWPFARSDQRQ